MSLEVRSANPAEISSYVLPTWLHSYALGYLGKLMRADARHGPGRDKYWSSQRAKIERILSTSTVSVSVAMYDGEPVGWVCFDGPSRTVHYIFVNRAFRRQGVAGQLMPKWFSDSAGGTVYLTHLPPRFFSKPADGEKSLWSPHQVIDCVTSY